MPPLSDSEAYGWTVLSVGSAKAGTANNTIMHMMSIRDTTFFIQFSSVNSTHKCG